MNVAIMRRRRQPPPSISSFGQGVLADPSLPASYPGLVNATTGSIYPQTGATPPNATPVPANDPVYEYRGPTADMYGGGIWCFPSTTPLGADPFAIDVAGGWTLNGVTTAPSGVMVGSTNAIEVTMPSIAYGDLYSGITSTASAISYSCWFQDPASGAAGRPNSPAFTRGVDIPFVGGLIPIVPSWTRVATTFSGGTSTAVGLTPAGASNAGSASNSGPAGSVIAYGYVATLGRHDYPILSGTASAAKTLDTTHSNLVVDAAGNLDLEVTFQASTVVSAETSGTYLWSFTTSDGLCALRMVIATSAPYFVLTVRGVDVLSTQSAGSGAWLQWQPGEPFTVRAWYNLSAGTCGIRQSVAGLVLPDTTGSTTGSALAKTTTVYLGSNLGSSTGALIGRMKPYRRPPPSVLAPPIEPVEVVIVGDSTAAAMTQLFALDGIGSYIYTQGAAGEWTTRPGIGELATPGYKILTATTQWNSSTANPWKTAASVKLVAIMIGINDVLNGASAASIEALYQTLVNDIAASLPGVPIVAYTMLPAGGYAGSTTSTQAVWTAVNAAILGGTITGLAHMIDAGGRGSPLNNGSDALASIYDTGDGLHESNAARMLLATDASIGLRPVLHTFGILP